MAPPSSQAEIDELEDDPELAPCLRIPSPKPKPKRVKSKRSKDKEAVSEPVQKPKQAPKAGRVPVKAKGVVQHPSSDSSSGSLERYRYKAPPAIEEKDENAKTRKRSREKGSRTGSESMNGAAEVKRARNDAIVFTMPELDEDGEPIIPASEPVVSKTIAERQKPVSPSSAPVPKSKKQVPKPPNSSQPSSSSVELPPGMRKAIRGRQTPSPNRSSAVASDRKVTLRAQHSSPAGPPRTAEEQQQIEERMAAFETDELDLGPDEDEVMDDVMASPIKQSVAGAKSPPPAEVEAEPQSGRLDGSPILSPVLPPLDGDQDHDQELPDIAVPARLDSNAFDRLLAGRLSSSDQLKSDREPFSSTSPIAQRRLGARHVSRGVQNRPPADLIAALAANPSPPRPKPTMRLVPLTPSGLTSHLEALLNSRVDDSASYKARVSTLEKSLAARDEEIGHLSDGLKTVKAEREVLVQQLEQGRIEAEEWQGKVDVLKEVRRGLLGELREKEARIAELEMEKVVWENERGLGPLAVGTEQESKAADVEQAAEAEQPLAEPFQEEMPPVDEEQDQLDEDQGVGEPVAEDDDLVVPNSQPD